jgi:hypothetical protein
MARLGPSPGSASWKRSPGFWPGASLRTPVWVSGDALRLSLGVLSAEQHGTLPLRGPFPCCSADTPLRLSVCASPSRVKRSGWKRPARTPTPVWGALPCRRGAWFPGLSCGTMCGRRPGRFVGSCWGAGTSAHPNRGPLGKCGIFSHFFLAL